MLSRILGVGMFAMVLVGASGEARAQDDEGMRSPAALGLGIALSSVGSAGLALGGYLFSSGSGSCDGISRSQIPTEAQIDGCRSGVNQQVGGVVSMVSGGAFLLAGIPLMIVGGTSSSDDSSAAKANDVPSVIFNVQPTGGQLTVSF